MTFEGVIVLLLVVGGLEFLRRRVGAPEWPTPQIVTAAALAGLLLFGIWYVAVYDTAAGRCSRGDLGACIVYEAQQRQR